MKNIDNLEIRETADSVILPLKVVPGSSRDMISGVLGGRLKIKTSAPPEKGEANKRVIAIISNALNIPGGQISICSGNTHPVKDLDIKGITVTGLKQNLSQL